MADSNRPNGLPAADLGAYLGPGTKISGKLHFDAQATIDGEVEGEIVCSRPHNRRTASHGKRQISPPRSWYKAK